MLIVQIIAWSIEVQILLQICGLQISVVLLLTHLYTYIYPYILYHISSILNLVAKISHFINTHWNYIEIIIIITIISI